MFAVYIIEFERQISTKQRHRWYAGQTENAFRRLIQHASIHSRGTRKRYGVTGMVFLWYVETRADALKLESDAIHDIARDILILPECCCSFITPREAVVMRNLVEKHRRKRERRLWLGLS